MKKSISLTIIIMLLLSSLFVLTGCGEKGEENNSDKSSKETTEIKYTLGRGIITLNVPKNEDGTPKYEFTDKKPEGMTKSGTFYLITDTANFAFATSGLAYNTSKDYKAKYGETTATFDGYLEFMDDTSISSRPKLSGMERFDINGRKALRYYNRTGGSGDYEYFGYFYLVAVDEIYKGSKLEMTVNYKGEENLKEVKEFDQETLDIINSLKVTQNK